MEWRFVCVTPFILCKEIEFGSKLFKANFDLLKSHPRAMSDGSNERYPSVALKNGAISIFTKIKGIEVVRNTNELLIMTVFSFSRVFAMPKAWSRLRPRHWPVHLSASNSGPRVWGVHAWCLGLPQLQGLQGTHNALSNDFDQAIY